MKMILYTFRTNKNVDQFLATAGLSLDTPVFIINKPSEDIPKLLDLIRGQEGWVIGLLALKKGRADGNRPV